MSEASNTPKKLTYGGLPVTQEYLDRYNVSSDQYVYETIAWVWLITTLLSLAGIVALLVFT